MTATEQALETARVAVAAAADKKAHDIVVLDVSDQLVITDCFVIASAPNERQVEAIVDAVEEKLRERGTKPVRREGAREGRWVLLDFVDVVVHVQHNEERGFYGLERLWKDCPLVDLPEEVRRGRSALEFIEKQGAIATRPDPAGRRIVTLIGPGWETAPGDPEAVPA